MTEPRRPQQPVEGVAPAPREPETGSWGNLSGAERVLRMLAGAAMLGAAWSGAVSGIAGVALQVFGWVPLATGVAGWCPFYAILGLSTRRRGARIAGRRERAAAREH
jgi:hypothetical protein